MRRRLQSITSKIPAAVALVVILVIWYGVSVSGVVPAYMLPGPVDVFHALVDDFDTILEHAGYTLQEAVYGLGIGIVLAFLAATVMDCFKTAERAFYPILVISQTIPTIAIAPLLVLWLGFDMAPKITLVVITTCFPITIGLLDGYKGVDPDEIKLMKSLGANRLQIFAHVKLPSALPGFFSGVKISASYAVVGAVVSEWLGGFNGLGVYMTRMKKAYAFDKMFAVIIWIVVVSLLLMGVVKIAGRLCMPWMNRKSLNKD